MSPDTKSQLKAAAGTTAVVAAALTFGVLLIPQPPKKAFLKWENGHGVDGAKATITDIVFTPDIEITDYTKWTVIGSVTNTNVFPMPKMGPKGFFNVSHRVRADGTME